jgi:hypothetical protein
MTSAATCRDLATPILAPELMTTDIEELMGLQRRRLAKARNAELAALEPHRPRRRSRVPNRRERACARSPV